MTDAPLPTRKRIFHALAADWESHGRGAEDAARSLEPEARRRFDRSFADLRRYYHQLATQYGLQVERAEALEQRADTLARRLSEAHRRTGADGDSAEREPAPPPFPEEIRAMADLFPVAVIDAGAQCLNREDHVYARLTAAGACAVTGFEPLEEAAAQRARAEPGVRMLPLFIGKGGPARFRITAFDPASSLLEPDPEFLQAFKFLPEMCKPVREVAVETCRLDDIPELGPQDCDFLKLDVQGGELDVLSGAERLLERTVFIHTEVEFAPLYRGQPLFADIDGFLRAREFELLDLIRPGHGEYAALPGRRGASRLLWADAVYVKSPDAMARRRPAALLKAAWIAHVNYGMLDFAAHLIARYDRASGTALLPVYQRTVGGG